MRVAGDAADDKTGRRVALGAVVLATVFVLWEAHLGLVLRNTHPAFGDIAAHLHEPAYLKEHLLPHGQLSGWSNDWFGGYPTGAFYFPGGGLLIALVSYVLPYTVAFKLIVIVGLVALPFCAYLFGRLHERDQLTSALLAVATLPYLLQGVTLMGGSIASTVGGEYGYALSLATALLVLGLAGPGLRTGRFRALAGALFAVTVLFHIIPALMAAVGLLVLVALQPSWARVRWAVEVLALGAGLAAFWVVPFLVHRQFTTGPDYAKAQPVSNYLFLSPMAILLVVAFGAAIAALLTVAKRDVFPAFMVIMAALSALAFAVTPTGRIWSARFLPFWLLFVALLAGWGVSRLAAFVDETRAEIARRRPEDTPIQAPFVALPLFLLLVPVLWGSPANRGVLMHQSLDVSAYASQSLAGFEGQPDRREFEGFIAMVRRLGATEGCGRAHWEWNQGDFSKWDDQRWGLMELLPYWTDGCIQGTEGLFVQGAATSVFAHLANNQLAAKPASFLGLPNGHLDVGTGVSNLRVLGVRYYIAVSPDAQQQADATSGLREVASTPVRGGRKWKVYEVADSSVVEPLAVDPVVVRAAAGSGWEAVAKRWFEHPDDRDVEVVSSGPAAWHHTRAFDPATLSRSPVGQSATASRVRLGNDTISFHVDQTGVPVLVRISYFPNWRVSGAKGPYRASPNWMVVVPTSHDVRLHYAGRAGAEWLGLLLTVLALAGLVFFARAEPLTMPEPVVVEEKPVAPRRPPPAPRRKQAKRRR
jgi:hypothetical protein